MKINKIGALALVIMTTACTTPLERRSQYVNARPDIPRDISQNIREGKVSVGMTKEQVEVSWGKPCWYCYGTRESTYGDTWEYNIFGTGSYGIGTGTYVFFDRSDRVRSVSR